MRNINDIMSHADVDLRALRDEEVDAVSGGRKTATATKTKATVRDFDKLVGDGVVTMDEMTTLHEM